MTQTARRRFRAAWIPNLIGLALLPLLLWLGFWQLDRSDEKSQRLVEFSLSGAEPLNIEDASMPAPAEFTPVSVTGRYDSSHQFLIDNMVRHGRNGFFVLTPFSLRGENGWILVNRGWVTQDPARRVLPALDIDENLQTIRGRVGRLPKGGIKLEAPEPPADEWPSVRQFPETAELSAALDEPLADWVLLLDADPDSEFERDWKPGGMPPERHFGYALQWFALALTLVVLVTLLNFEKVVPNDE